MRETKSVVLILLPKFPENSIISSISEAILRFFDPFYSFLYHYIFLDFVNAQYDKKAQYLISLINYSHVRNITSRILWKVKI